MKIYIRLTVSVLLITCLIFLSCRENKIVPEKEIARSLLIRVDSFASTCNQLKAYIQSGSSDQSALQESFLRARLAFKKFEWAAEYFEPLTAKAINGPPVPEAEISGQIIQPSGLQIMETLLFPSYDSANKRELLKQIGILQDGCDLYKN